MKKRAIITAAITAAFMAAGAIGGTIAYFNTQSQTDVNVTSGKISIVSTVSNLQTYSLGVAQPAGTFENGGTATLSDHTITLDRMTPGDKVTFKIAVANESNVKIKYRVSFNKNGDLAPVLATEVNGGASEWTPLEIGSSNINLEASIEMPITTGIEYNNKQGSVSIVVEAVQGNMPQAVSTAAEIQQAISQIPSTGGELSLYLENDIALNQVIEIPSNSEINLLGNGDVTISTPNGARRPIILDGTQNSTLTIAGVDIEGPSNITYANGIGMWDTNDCTVNLYDVDLHLTDYYGINVSTGNDNLTVNINDSKVEAWGAINIISPNTTVNVSNSILRGTNPHSGSSNAFGVIVAYESAPNTTINLDNCVVESIQQGDQYEAFIDMRGAGDAITSTNTIYKYYRLNATEPEIYNSIEELADYNSFVRFYSNDSSAYVGSGLAGIQLGDDTAELQYPFISIDEYLNAEQLTDVGQHLYGERQELLAADIWGEQAPRFSASDLTINGQHFIVVDYNY